MHNFAIKDEIKFSLFNSSKSCKINPKTPFKDSNHSYKNNILSYSMKSLRNPSSPNKKNSTSAITSFNSKSISFIPSPSPSKDINKLSNSKITSKFIPSVIKVKQYNNSLNKLFDLKLLKMKENAAHKDAEIRIKSSHPLFLGKTNCGSLCVNSNDFNIGFVEKRRYLNYDKKGKNNKKIIINPSFSNFVEIVSLIENNKKSQQNSKKIRSPNLKNILASCNNRKDMVTYNNYIFKK